MVHCRQTLNNLGLQMDKFGIRIREHRRSGALACSDHLAAPLMIVDL